MHFAAGSATGLVLPNSSLISSKYFSNKRLVCHVMYTNSTFHVTHNNLSCVREGCIPLICTINCLLFIYLFFSSIFIYFRPIVNRGQFCRYTCTHLFTTFSALPISIHNTSRYCLISVVSLYFTMPHAHYILY